MTTKSKEDQKWRPLKELAPFTPYKVGYLSLMARRKNLKVKKIKGVWHSSLEEVKAFELLMRKRKEERKKLLSRNYHLKSKEKNQKSSPAKNPSKETGFKILVKGETIFDEVQKELKEVLSEIREKEREIRKDYLDYKKRSQNYPFRKTEADLERLEKAKEKEEAIAEKLIIDLGKLLNTAHQIHEEREEIRQSDPEEIKSKVVSVPIKNKSKGMVAPQRFLPNTSTKEEEVVFSNRDDFSSLQASRDLPFDDTEKNRRENSILLTIAITLFLLSLAMAVFVALM